MPRFVLTVIAAEAPSRLASLAVNPAASLHPNPRTMECASTHACTPMTANAITGRLFAKMEPIAPIAVEVRTATSRVPRRRAIRAIVRLRRFPVARRGNSTARFKTRPKAPQLRGDLWVYVRSTGADFQFTAPSGRVYSFSTEGGNTDFDTVLYARTIARARARAATTRLGRNRASR